MIHPFNNPVGKLRLTEVRKSGHGHIRRDKCPATFPEVCNLPPHHGVSQGIMGQGWGDVNLSIMRENIYNYNDHFQQLQL